MPVFNLQPLAKESRSDLRRKAVLMAVPGAAVIAVGLWLPFGWQFTLLCLVLASLQFIIAAALLWGRKNQTRPQSLRIDSDEFALVFPRGDARVFSWGDPNWQVKLDYAWKADVPSWALFVTSTLPNPAFPPLVASVSSEIKGALVHAAQSEGCDVQFTTVANRRVPQPLWPTTIRGGRSGATPLQA